MLPSIANVGVQRFSIDGAFGLQRGPAFITIDMNTLEGLVGEAFGMLIESTNGTPFVAERSMYWDSNGVFWAGGLATAGTRLP